MTDFPAETYDVMQYKGEMASETLHGEKYTVLLRGIGKGAEDEPIVMGFVNEAEQMKWAKAIKAAQKVAELKAAASKVVTGTTATPKAGPAALPPGYTRQSPDIDTLTDEQMRRRIAEGINFFEPSRISSLAKMQPLLKGRERDVLNQTYKRHGGPAPSYETRVTVFCSRYCPSELDDWLAKLSETVPGKEYDEVIKPLATKFNGGKEY
jgi:hypothetical protein